MRALITLTLWAITHLSYAITNIEERRLTEHDSGWQRIIELGFNGESGNNKKRQWNNAVNASWQNDDIRFFSWASYQYGSSNDIKTDDNAFFHNRLVFNHRRVWAQEVYTQYQSDPFAALERRLLFGAGLRYQHRFSETSFINQGIGVFHEEVREREQKINIEQQTRLSLYTFKTWNSGTYRLQSTLYLQPVINDMDDVKAIWQWALVMPLGPRTEWRWQWQSNWDSKPPANTVKDNHKTQFKWAFRF